MVSSAFADPGYLIRCHPTFDAQVIISSIPFHIPPWLPSSDVGMLVPFHIARQNLLTASMLDMIENPWPVQC